MLDEKKLEETITRLLREKIEPIKDIHDSPFDILLYGSSRLLVEYLLGKISDFQFDRAYSVLEQAATETLKRSFPASLEFYLHHQREVVYQAKKEFLKMREKE